MDPMAPIGQSGHDRVHDLAGRRHIRGEVGADDEDAHCRSTIAPADQTDDVTTRRPPRVIAAGTATGSGTTVALAALLAGAPAGTTVVVPVDASIHDAELGPGVRLIRRGRLLSLAGEAVGWPRGRQVIGFCDRLPLVPTGASDTVLVVQNPHLYEPDDSTWPFLTRRKFAALRWWAQRSARRADRVICSTAASRTAVLAATGIAADRVEVRPIPALGIVRSTREITGPISTVLLVGDVYPHKRHHEAIAALQSFASSAGRRIDVVHLGRRIDQAAGADLDRAVANAPFLDVTLRGAVSRSEVLCALAAADVLLLASTSETQGLALAEAQSVGIAVVARSIGPFRDLAGGGTALIDSEQFVFGAVEALSRLDDPQLRAAAVRRSTPSGPLPTCWDVWSKAM